MIREARASIMVAFIPLFLGLLTPIMAPTAEASTSLPVANVTVIPSSPDAYAPLQTLTYRSTVTASGYLSQVTMGIPDGASVGSLRSSSGTVKILESQPRFLVWKPARPISVAVGARLIIPVEGFYFRSAGSYRLGFRAVNAVGGVLSAGYGSLALVFNTTPCPTAWQGNYIKTENAKSGSFGWQIPAAAFNPAALSAYASRQSASCGDKVYLKVDAPSSSSLRLSVYRVGYYGGVGARKVWGTPNQFLGGRQSPVTIRNGTNSLQPDNMASANHWWFNVGIRIDGSFTPGTYLIRVDDGVGHQTFVPLTVLDSTNSPHAYRLQQATTTWQAYNKYGGRSFYTTPGSAKLTFDRPYMEGQGSGQFLALEYGLVVFMEQQGMDVDYWTDMDLHNQAASLPARIKTLIIPAHDEYYSLPMRNGLVSGIAKGVNLVSFGANQIHRQIRPETNQSTFVVYERWTSWPLSTTWRYRGYANNEQAITGSQYGCRSNGTVTTNDNWLWTGVAPGTKLIGFANGETDYMHPTRLSPIPVGTTVLTSAPLDGCAVSGEQLKMDIVARDDASGARVYGGSTFAYSCFLVRSCPTNWRVGGLNGTTLAITAVQAEQVGQMVLNVLSWANHGVTTQQKLDEGSLNRFQAQLGGSTAPSGGLPSLTVEEDQDD